MTEKPLDSSAVELSRLKNFIEKLGKNKSLSAGDLLLSFFEIIHFSISLNKREG